MLRGAFLSGQAQNGPPGTSFPEHLARTGGKVIAWGRRRRGGTVRSATPGHPDGGVITNPREAPPEPPEVSCPRHLLGWPPRWCAQRRSGRTVPDRSTSNNL